MFNVLGCASFGAAASAFSIAAVGESGFGGGEMAAPGGTLLIVAARALSSESRGASVTVAAGATSTGVLGSPKASAGTSAGAVGAPKASARSGAFFSADAAAAVSGFVRSTVWNGSAAAFSGVASRDARFSPFAAQKPSPSLTALCKAASGGGVRGRSLLLVQPIAVASQPAGGKTERQN